MKKLLLLIAILQIGFCQAQDYAYLNNLKLMGIEQTEKVAEDFFAAARGKYKLYKTREIKEQNSYTLQYVPAELTDGEIKEKIEMRTKGFSVVFKFEHVGPNYRLTEIISAYRLIFPFWKKYFNPDANAETTKSDYRKQEVKDISRKIYFYIQRYDNVWRLYNHS